ncbi:MAG TPA: phosphotransferase, partial [Candidatus Hydrogenedentes bacterium]|nr:phosphotransferase [Candidatus Hydrogenedentota bacterium]
KDGKGIVDLGSWALELQEYVDGDPMTVSGGTLIISAQALGRFHTVCRDFPRPERDARMWRFSEVPRESLKNIYERAREEGAPETAADCCNRIALFLRGASEILNWEARASFETGLIHGDWHSGNLIFKGDKLAAIVDLEFAGDGCYLEDLAYAISNLCVRTTDREERLAKRVDLLLHEYQRHRPLSFAEISALFHAVGVKHVATVSFQISSSNPVVAGLNSFQWLERLAFQLEWLEKRAKAARWGQ